MMKEYNIKLCPYCGGKAKLHFRVIRNLGMTARLKERKIFGVAVRCNRCYARGPLVSSPVLEDINPNALHVGFRQKSREAMAAEIEKAVSGWNVVAKEGDGE